MKGWYPHIAIGTPHVAPASWGAQDVGSTKVHVFKKERIAYYVTLDI